MDWTNKHVNGDLYSSYDQKYGVSNYFDWQRVMYEHADLHTTLSKLREFSCPRRILDVGINSGFEISEIQKLINFHWKLEGTCITGVDLSLTALQVASERFSEEVFEFKSVNSDITEFIINDTNRYDCLIAITSLQSASVYDENYEPMLKKLLSLLDRKSVILITCPNCYYSDGEILTGGVWNVRYNYQDPQFASQFINRTMSVLNKYDFVGEIQGDAFVSIIGMLG